MRQAALLVVLVCVLLAPVTTVAALGGSQQSLRATQDDLARDGVDVTIHLQSDGDARWNVSASYDLATENESAAFARLAEQFKTGQTDPAFSVDVFEAALPGVAEQVGRPMEITGAHRSATTIQREDGNATGVLTVRFTWTNFSAVTNETLTVDSFAGTWFGDLQDGQTLTIHPPEGFGTEDVQPGPSAVSNGAYRWEGPQSFDAGEPTIVFSKSAVQQGPGGLSLPVLGGLVLFALVLGGIAAWAYQRGDASAILSSGGDESGDGGSGPGTPPAAGATESRSTEQSTEADGLEEASDAGATAGPANGDDVDPELLSDEERVERLLRENGGRMKQGRIVEETRWSNAKVSQLLSSMDDAGRIEKLRIGRENLISLPGEGVGDGGQEE